LVAVTAAAKVIAQSTDLDARLNCDAMIVRSLKFDSAGPFLGQAGRPTTEAELKDCDDTWSGGPVKAD
jgi:hypothetical protein